MSPMPPKLRDRPHYSRFVHNITDYKLGTEKIRGALAPRNRTASGSLAGLWRWQPSWRQWQHWTERSPVSPPPP